MFTNPLLEEKLRVQAELSARCPTMAQYLDHNEAAARKVAAEHGFTLHYRLPEGFQSPALDQSLLPPLAEAALILNDRG
ncbi:MAG: hypothetical protein NTW03_18440 [Verrucomicrobia bacterium]|nr:hypothetical protein [Verrucomicrobiota bacterium]